MKALYLDGRRELHVRLDGPALRVRRPGCTDGHYPLPRVARVIAVGSVDWQPDALTSCLRDHKPVAVLDGRGRFVRVLFRTPGRQYGLARHMGELLAVPRFRERYTHWYQTAERAEMQAAVRLLDIHCRDLQPDNLWQRICLEQHRRWDLGPGACYRYLLGLAAAQIASAFSLIGMPRNPLVWERQEYRLFCHTLRLERWRLAVLLEQILTSRFGPPGRRELTASFEDLSGERDIRIASWRRDALVAMMGIGTVEEKLPSCELHDRKPLPAEMGSTFSRLSQASSNHAGNRSRIVFGAQASLRNNVRILRGYLEYDRRMHESYGTT